MDFTKQKLFLKVKHIKSTSKHNTHTHTNTQYIIPCIYYVKY